MTTNNLLTRRHPRYKELEPHWRFLIQTWQGGPGWLADNIFKYFKEGPEEFKLRLKRAYRDNVSRDLVEVYTDHLYKVPVERDQAAPPPVQDFWRKATKGKEGKSIDDFMREASDKSSACSPVAVVVDMPAPPAIAPISVAEATAAGLTPYAYIVWPTDLLDWGIDEAGELTWIVIFERVRDDADPFTATGEWIVRYRLWTREGWSLWEEGEGPDKEPTLVDEGTHPIGRVPVRLLSHKAGSDPYCGQALLEEIAYKDRALANRESQLDVIICDQTFSQLFIPDDGIISEPIHPTLGDTDTGGAEARAERRRRRMVKMGTNRIATWNGKSAHKPFFASPDASQGNLIREVIADLRAEMWEDALLGSEGRNKSSGPRTATEAEHDFEKLNGALADKAAGLEALERWMAEMVCGWTGTSYDPKAAEAWVVYARKFNVQALADKITEILSLQQITSLGPTFWVKVLERFIEDVLPDLKPEEKQAILDEIKANQDTALLMSQAALMAAQLDAGGEVGPAGQEDPHDDAGPARKPP